MLQQNARWIGLTNQKEEEKNEKNIIQSMLEDRGIVGKEAQDAFLHPSLDYIQAASDLHQIDIALNRIHLAIEEQEHIVIFGDYDADGITSTAVLYKAMQELEAFCDFYVPNRITEGYGLNKAAIERLYADGVSLIITVDNGIASVDEVDFAKSLGLDVIITDHHEIQDRLPAADAIIHPKLSDAYEWKELAGVGVAFQLATALLGKLDQTLLDLVAIGTVADLVPLLGENRIFTSFGLRQLEQTEHIGLKLLMDHCRVEKPITEEAIGFRIGPRLNAVGRLDEASIAVQLLITEDEDEAKEIVAYIDDLNGQRQQLVTKIVKEAEEKIALLPEEGVIMLYDETWHEGVLGIVASRIVNKYNRPTFIFTHKTETDQLKGSARSIPAFDLFANCMELQDAFIAFGGHAQAAGMSLEVTQLDFIWEQLDIALKNQCSVDDFTKELKINQSLPLTDVTEAFVSQVQAFAPFGMENEKPLFHLSGKAQTVRTIGQNNNHLKLQLLDGDDRVDCIGFHKGIDAYYIGKNEQVEVVGYVQINEWNGNRTVQLLTEDLRIQEQQVFDYRGKKQQFPLDKTVEQFHTHIIIANEVVQTSKVNQENVLTLPAEHDFTRLQTIDVLYLFDLPKTKEKMIELLTYTKPKNIFLCYDMDMDALFEQVPSRDDFKWVYGYLRQTKQAIVTEKIKEIMQVQGWKQDKVIFIVHVLLDLQFIYLDERVVCVNEHPEKKPLEDAKAFKDKQEKQQMDRLFYQDTFQELSNWIKETMLTAPINQEETVHEL